MYLHKFLHIYLDKDSNFNYIRDMCFLPNRWDNFQFLFLKTLSLNIYKNFNNQLDKYITNMTCTQLYIWSQVILNLMNYKNYSIFYMNWESSNIYPYVKYNHLCIFRISLHYIFNNLMILKFIHITHLEDKILNNIKHIHWNLCTLSSY